MSYHLINQATGQAEQTFETKKAADKHLAELKKREPELHLGEPVTYKVEKAPAEEG